MNAKPALPTVTPVAHRDRREKVGSLSASPQEGAPQVSVIVTAYNRKEFILSAVQSVLSQTVSRRAYEILVIKNYTDPAIDSWLASKNVTTLLGEGTIGEFLYEGVRAAKGRIVCFLDDDDRWFPDKLQKVIEVFGSPGTVYYHDAHVPFSAGTAKPLWSPLYTRPKAPLSLGPGLPDRASLREVLSSRGDINLSSMAVAKRVFAEDRLNALRRISAASDWFVFLCALESEERLLFDSEAHSAYRLHDSTVNRMSSGLSDFVNHRVALIHREIASLEVEHEVFLLPVTREFIESRIATDALQVRLLQPGLQHPPSTVNAKTRLVRADFVGLTLMMLFCVSLVSKSLALRLYFVALSFVTFGHV